MMARRWIFLLPLLLSVGMVARASSLPDYPFVSTGGKAQAWMPPDVGELQFDVGAQQPSAEQAAAALQAQCASIAALLASHGIGEADVEGYELAKKAVELTNPAADGATQAWSLGRHFRVQVRDLSQWPALLTEVMALDHLDGVSVQFDRSDRERVNAQLLAEAAKDARSNGALLAESFGRKLGPAVAIARAPLDKVGAPYLSAPEQAPIHVPREAGVAVTSSSVLQYTVPLSIPFAQSVTAIFRLKGG